jgi:glycosyltransferase involved in cell wall biosynthesis
MKICFISNGNINYGSYRIWVNDLNNNLNHLGYTSKINPQDPENYDIIIFGKNINVSKVLPSYVNKYNNKKYGWINAPNDKNIFTKYCIDNLNFVIAGSIEEKDTLLKYNKNVFIYPLIENMYLNVKRKKHIKKNEIIIGYHGNIVHLNHLNLSFNKAVEKIKEKYKNIYKIKLLVITNSLNNWGEKNRPNIDIEFKKWDLKTIKNDLINIDIGIVPTISYFKYDHKDFDNSIGKYNSDICIRFKNKSNNGRTLVFFQLGIPVIADYTPSNMHILGDEKNGYAVLSSNGWYNAIENLICENKRQEIANNAYKEYKMNYDCLKWTEKLYKEIKNIEP